MKHPALPFKICTKGQRLGRVGGGLRVPFLPFLLAPDQPQPQLGIFSPCGFHGAFLLPSVLTFVFQSMPFPASHTVTVISPPFPWHSHPDLDISHPLFPLLDTFSSWSFAPGVALSLQLQSPGDLGRMWRRWEGLSPPSWCEKRFWILLCLNTYSSDWPVLLLWEVPEEEDLKAPPAPR